MKLKLDQQVHFTEGLLGFESYHEFTIRPHAENSPFYLMTSEEDSSVTFILVSPLETFEGYEMSLPEYIVEALQIKHHENVMIYTLVTLKDPIESSTTNLSAPIVINTENSRAMQIILNDERFSIREPLFTGTNGGER